MTNQEMMDSWEKAMLKYADVKGRKYQAWILDKQTDCDYNWKDFVDEDRSFVPELKDK